MDHTSLIKFIEARFADEHPHLIEPNITPWRRAVVGDLTSAFDFAHPEAWRMIQLPNTDAFKPAELIGHPDDVPVPPATQQLPAQEHGVRAARALPYALEARGMLRAADGSVRIDFSNSGRATAVFHVRSSNPLHGPRTYTVEPGKHLAGVWPVGAIGAAEFDLVVHGPNGFLRALKGGVSPAGAHLDVRPDFDATTNRLTLTIANSNTQATVVAILDRYTGETTTRAVAGGGAIVERSSLARFSGWYDFVIVSSDDASSEYELAGHLETGRDSITDPLMGGLVRIEPSAAVSA